MSRGVINRWFDGIAEIRLSCCDTHSDAVACEYTKRAVDNFESFFSASVRAFRWPVKIAHRNRSALISIAWAGLFADRREGQNSFVPKVGDCVVSETLGGVYSNRGDKDARCNCDDRFWSLSH